ncbi:unnamed protein product [Prorocentrum cordatum]|uniref:Chlorophyll a-b binding protein, chloroplastic n=1 Tax=Prorocentrum cordatum TaxID=2364126 RepID=A0ABN9XPT0_9DINO|nr:unnamed protein product [Polarella glacialis]CAK0901931.1 unnamed protein product [Polarella glacialis]
MAARRSSAAGRLAVLALAALVLRQLTARAFVAPPRAQADVHAAAALAGAGVVATAPLPAQAIELTYEGFGAPELLVIALPWLIAIPGFTQWLMVQPFKDEDVKGYGTLGRTVDAPGEAGYFRRSPESG